MQKYECQTVGDLKKALDKIGLDDETPLIGVSDEFRIGQGLVIQYVKNSKMDGNKDSPATGLSVDVSY